MNLTAWQPEDGPVQAVTVMEGLQDRAMSCFLPEWMIRMPESMVMPGAC